MLGACAPASEITCPELVNDAVLNEAIREVERDGRDPDVALRSRALAIEAHQCL